MICVHTCVPHLPYLQGAVALNEKLSSSWLGSSGCGSRRSVFLLCCLLQKKKHNQPEVQRQQYRAAADQRLHRCSIIR